MGLTSFGCLTYSKSRGVGHQGAIPLPLPFLIPAFYLPLASPSAATLVPSFPSTPSCYEAAPWNQLESLGCA